MNSIISNIIHKKCSIHEKRKELDLLSRDIEIANDILNGKFGYCKECDDFYLTKSFITEHETMPTQICVYEDPINSGANDYVDGYADITYSICPKGHKHEIERKERRK